MIKTLLLVGFCGGFTTFSTFANENLALLRDGDFFHFLIYTGSTDKFEHTPPYEVIVYAARSYGLTGATVLKGIMGYGASSEIYSNKLWEISEKVPLIIEIIDESHKIEPFIEHIMPYFEKAGKGYVITLDETTVLMHKTGSKK